LLRDALPPVLTETQYIDGYNMRAWRARELTPAERPLIEASLAALDERLKPVTDEWLLKKLASLYNHWNDPRNDEERDQLYADYADDLDEFSQTEIDEACTHWRRSSKWFPKVAELRADLEKRRARNIELRRRALILLEDPSVTPHRWEVPPPALRDEKLRPADEVLATFNSPLGRALQSFRAAQKGKA
jgi:hypothetical protein